MHQSAKEILTDVEKFIKHYQISSHQALIEGSCYYRASQISDAEVITILILYQLSGYKTFKYFYHEMVLKRLKSIFHFIPSYSWFIRRQRNVLMIMLGYLYSKRGHETGVYFIDSTHIKVCHNRRIYRHKTFKDLAMRGHTSIGWFYGFKLHLVINNQGEFRDIYLTKGNSDDRIGLEKMAYKLKGLMMADKGYLSKEHARKLSDNGLKLVTRLRKNMKQRCRMSKAEKYYLNHRGIIETVIDILKNIFQLENTKIRSVANFFQNIISALIAYALRPYKPYIPQHFNAISRN